MKNTSKLLMIFVLLAFSFPPGANAFLNHPGVTERTPIMKTGLYRLFETQVVNNSNYTNPFIDVELSVQYQAPSGRIINFMGFYDGDGEGGGDSEEGNVWKMRFMPDEIGTWNYVYTWSDGSEGGRGSFVCTEDNAGKGVLRAYEGNPHWFAYNSKEPVWLKSYYETGHGSIGQDFDWVVQNVYSKFKEHGYNHLQVNWLLSLCCFGQYYTDGPEPITLDLQLYEEGKITETMNLSVWHRMEKHMDWLNNHDIFVHMFLGVDGSKNDGPAWEALSPVEKDFYVKYAVARIAPYANLAGWNFVWEVPGNRRDHELGFARLVEKYDVFDHLRTYEDEMPRENYYDLPAYSFAAVENHEIAAPDKNNERHLWKEPWTHHMACLLAYRGKPVFMSEGNALWRRFWQERTKATQDDLRRSAWACATAGASFTWNGHASEYALVAGGSEGLPFNGENPYRLSETYISILSDVMSGDIEFFRMKPQDELLSDHPALAVYALAQPGNQYLVFSTGGTSFSLMLEKGRYPDNQWINAESGNRQKAASITIEAEKEVKGFTPPDQKADWVLLIRK